MQERASLRASQAQVGRTLEVLVEGGDRRGSSTKARSKARSRTNRIVHLGVPLDPGTFVDARVTTAAPHHLLGEVVPAATVVAH